MTDIAINPVARRAQFTGNTGTGPFAFTFNILADADIAVYKNTTLLTLTTDYTISTNANGTGSVTLTGSNNGTALVASDVLTIIGGRNLSRTTDFVTAGDLLASSLNEQLDSIVVMAQQLDEKLTRSVKVNPGDVFTDLELPLKDARKGTVLGFNATSGDPEPGPTIADTQALAAITADIATLADIEDGTDATDAIQTAASNSSNISTVAGISGNVTTVAGIASNVTSVAGNATNINTVAGDTADINALAGKTTELGLLGTSDAVSDMNTLGTADVVSDMNTLGTSSNVTNMDTLAGISSNITTVAGVASNVTTVAGSISNVNTTATNISSVNTNATNISAIQGASANASTATTKASEAATSATNAASSATSAATAQTAAEAARDSALAAFDSFDDRYLGAKSSAPTVDNDGNALVSGALYYDTTANAMQVYTGSAWVAAYASLSGALLVTNNLSDVNNAATSATNLGLGTGNTPTFNGINTTGDISFGDSDKAKFGASNDLSIFHDSNNSFIKDSGTGSLYVQADAGVYITNASGSENKAIFTSDGAVNLYHDNSIKMQTSSSGISVTGRATADTIDVGGNDTGSAGLINVYGGGSGEGGEIKIYPSAANDTTIDSFSIDIAGDALRIFDSNGDMHSQFVPNGAAELYHNGSKKFETSSNGIAVTGSDYQLKLNQGSNQPYLIRHASDNSLRMHLNGTGDRLTIDANGKLGVGTSSPDALAHIYSGASGVTNPHSYTKLHIESADHSAIQLSGNNTAEQWIWFADDTSSTPKGGLTYYHGNDYMGFRTNGAERMRLEHDGDLHVDGNVIAYSTTISDERLKQNIKPITGALDKVGQLSGYTFTYKNDGKESAGVIAQEVEAVLPSAVSESTLPLKTDDGVEYKTVEYDQLVGLLIESVKELKAEIEELKNGSSN